MKFSHPLILSNDEKRRMVADKQFTAPEPPLGQRDVMDRPVGSWTVQSWVEYIDEQGQWDVDLSKLYQGKKRLLQVCRAHGWELGNWRESGPTSSYYHYALVKADGHRIRVSVSLGGIVSVDGKPFTPHQKHNLTVASIEESMMAVVMPLALSA